MGYGIRNSSQAPVVQTLDGAIHRTNDYPADENHGNQLRYPLNTDLSSAHSAIHRNFAND